MRNIVSFLLLVLLVFTGCSKKDDNRLFQESADERLNKTLASYQTLLSGAENGWKAVISPKNGSSYFFYFKFNSQNRVKMYSTFDFTSAVTPAESSYRLKALQQPSLVFDTYSYLHVLSDPDPDVNGGTTGQGLQSDFEFYFEEASADTIKLVGRFNGSKMVLTPATKQEADELDNQGLANSFLFNNLTKYLNYFKRVVIGGITYEITVSLSGRILTFNWLDANGELQTFSTPYYYSSTGINFVNPLISGNQTISGLTNLTWNANTTTLGFSVNGTPTTVVGLGQPLKVDVDAPARFKQYAVSQGDVWISWLGWHINGVDDALDLSSLIPNYAAAMYAPKEAAPYGWTLGDLGGVLFDGGNSLRSSSYVSTVNNGIIRFAIQGNNASIGFGTPLTASQRNYVVGPTNSFRSVMTDPAGFYVIQTGPLSYDMVRASDGLAWISWEWIW